MSNQVTVKQEGGVAEEQTRPGRTYLPNVEIRETEDALWLWADMPGVDQSSIDIHLENGVLSIEGQVETDEYADLTPAYTEYNVGNFELLRIAEITGDVVRFTSSKRRWYGDDADDARPHAQYSRDKVRPAS